MIGATKCVAIVTIKDAINYMFSQDMLISRTILKLLAFQKLLLLKICGALNSID